MPRSAHPFADAAHANGESPGQNRRFSASGRSSMASAGDRPRRQTLAGRRPARPASDRVQSGGRPARRWHRPSCGIPRRNADSAPRSAGNALPRAWSIRPHRPRRLRHTRGKSRLRSAIRGSLSHRPASKRRRNSIEPDTLSHVLGVVLIQAGGRAMLADGHTLATCFDAGFELLAGHVRCSL